ncbi:MAG TPA: RsmB/NOP family class I SAM-dependent RNA methyltransferase [bacterium]|nr:RsmB/NOP family class I SAM-dependent RNA methyltransferase [bacterium]HQG44049.1 RsmB/NOP family class I SAM-dependent RNA methyltransferase [bacterium]HQI48796.1 RsmB/NOP family class I SAM-dependent RNA methyltransferase [bacterium]HQJ63557.1 RsmB/NOP family class I SAM-dependent RNA methyltransferase [bacterium]
MTPGPDLSALILEACTAILEGGRRADAALQYCFREHRTLTLPARNEVATAVYDIVRRARWLAALESGDPAAPPAVSPTLHATWRLWRGERTAATPADREVLERAGRFAALRPLRESLPDWLDALGLHERGDRWEPLLAALNQPAVPVLRVNTLKTRLDQVVAAVAAHGAACRRVEFAPDALAIEGFAPVFAWEEYKKGWFELQDAASQAVALFLEVKPGMRVVDGCAGNGGKSLHLASLMGNRGRIIALDIAGDKLAALEHRARRAGATNIETRIITSTKVIKRLAGSADRVLLDVPCSGSGVWRRNPDARWRLHSEDLTRLLAEQQHILGYYSKLLRPGGRLVYATCSLFPCEGEQQVAAFLAATSGAFALAAEKRLDPDLHGFDGFYMAALERC